MSIFAITNETEHAAALAEYDRLAEALGDAPTEHAVAEVRALGLVISDYESRRWPIPEPDPIEFIKFMMEQKGLKVSDVASCFGSSYRAYEVLNRRRNLTLVMVRKLRDVLGCSADALLEA